MDLTTISTKYRSEVSISGYDLTVLKSGLQKYIRRNNYEMALKMTMELYYFDYIDGGKRIFTNALHRLQIIFLEDIGCGNIALWRDLVDWFEIIFNERVKENRNRNLEIITLKRIVLNLCRCKKIRAASFMNSIFVINNVDENNIINCEYIDKTITNDLDNLLKNKDWRSIVVLRKLLFAIDDAKRAEKTKLKKDTLNILSKHLNNDYLNYAQKWTKDIGKLKESYILYFVPLCDYLYGSDEYQIDNTKLSPEWDIEIGKIVLDDFVYDRHVKNAKDNSLEYFANISSIVEPEAENVKIPKEFETIYKWLKGDKIKILNFGKNNVSCDEEIMKESSLDFICRAQLVTSMSKTDTYYARDKEGILYLVKGPYLFKEPIEEFILYQGIKKETNLNYVDCKIVEMIADRWPERPGLGLRHKLATNEKGYFLFSKSIIEEKNLTIIRHPGSKKWESTDVVDLKKFSVNLYFLNDEQLIQYINNIAFRIKYNLGDLADRNFILVNNKVYSVDENKNKHRQLNLLNEMKKKKFEYFCKKFEELKNKIRPEFTKIIEENIHN